MWDAASKEIGCNCHVTPVPFARRLASAARGHASRLPGPTVGRATRPELHGNWRFLSRNVRSRASRCFVLIRDSPINGVGARDKNDCEIARGETWGSFVPTAARIRMKGRADMRDSFQFPARKWVFTGDSSGSVEQRRAREAGHLSYLWLPRFWFEPNPGRWRFTKSGGEVGEATRIARQRDETLDFRCLTSIAGFVVSFA